MNQGFNMQDVMRMAMMQQGQAGQMGMMPGMAAGGMPLTPAGMTPQQLEELMKMRQAQQMAMQMMQAGRPSAQQQAMPMGLMNFLGK